MDRHGSRKATLSEHPRVRAVKNQMLTDPLYLTVGLLCARFQSDGAQPPYYTLLRVSVQTGKGSIRASFPCEPSKIIAKNVSFGCKV